MHPPHERRSHPLNCTIPDCKRKARSLKSGICGTHYERQRLNREPRLPVAPLLAFAADREMTDALGTMPDNDLGLFRADTICVDVLKVHPADVYGDMYWNAA